MLRLVQSQIFYRTCKLLILKFFYIFALYFKKTIKEIIK